jgi:hypothetical protein
LAVRPGTIGAFFMSNDSPRDARRFTSFFTSISAGDVNVPALALGSAGSRSVPSHVLTTQVGLFTIGPDLAHLMAEGSTRRFVPASPATQSDVIEAELLAAD